MKLPKLRAVREGKLLTQRGLAGESGVTFATISRIENGQDAQLSTVRKLAAALGVKPQELVDDA